MFLPAPYSPDFDRTLIECVNEWHTRKQAGGGGMEAAEEPAVTPAKIDSAGHEAAAALAAKDEPVLLEPEPAPAMSASQPTMFAGVDDSKSMFENSPVPLEASPPPVPVSRLNPARTSSTNLPPVPKFNPSVSRPMPGVSLVSEDAEPRHQGMTAEEILDGVTQQSERSPEASEPMVFDERTTADIHTAFSALSVSTPPDHQQDASGSASHLLKRAGGDVAGGR